MFWQDGEFDWSPKEQSLALSSFFYAYIILQFPGGSVSERFGAKWVIFVCVFFPGVLYILIPSMAHLGVEALIVVQFLSGLLQVSANFF